MSDFDTPIDRHASDSIKWNKYAGRDVLPLWVADMDFAAPPPIQAALSARLAHGVFGYGHPETALTEAVQQHLARHYDWSIEAEWIVWLPGLVTGLNVACRAVDGDVLTATPIYPPFFSAPRHAGKSLQGVPLVQGEHGWQWDWSAMHAALTPNTRLLLLCHPHNPVGRCWRDDELRSIADFALQHDLVVCSDEIHCGLVLDAERRHIPLASLDPAIAARSITLMAPSKTFNIPGLGCAFALIPDPALRRRFLRTMEGIVPHVNVLGLAACTAAYRDCDAWHADLLAYLRANRDCVQAAVAAEAGVRMSAVEATYLAWIDVRELGLSDPAAHFEAHGLGLSDGKDFGAPGWLRLNFGCPRASLDQALARFHAACVAARNRTPA